MVFWIGILKLIEFLCLYKLILCFLGDVEFYYVKIEEIINNIWLWFDIRIWMIDDVWLLINYKICCVLVYSDNLWRW